MWKEPRVSAAREVSREPQSDRRGRERGGENRREVFRRQTLGVRWRQVERWNTKVWAL